MDNLYFGQKTNNEFIVRNFDYDKLKGKIEQIDSSIGNDGDSAYDIATYHGYYRTVYKWLESLKGTDATNIKLKDVTSNLGIRLDVLHKNTDEEDIRTWDITAVTTANELVNFIPLPCTRVTPNVQIFGGTATLAYNNTLDSGKLTLNLCEFLEGTQYFTTEKLLLDDFGTHKGTRGNNYIMVETFDNKSFSNLIDYEEGVSIVSNITNTIENSLSPTYTGAPEKPKLKYYLTKNEFELGKADLDKLIKRDESNHILHGDYVYLHFISITTTLREDGGSVLPYYGNVAFTGNENNRLEVPDFVSVLVKFKIKMEELK